MKKSILIVSVCVIVVFSLVPITAHADSIINYNGFNFDKALGRINSIDSSVSGDVVIPNTIDGVQVSSIHEFAFYSKTNITSITLPKYLVELPQNAFRSCSNLQNVYFEDGSIINKIGDNAFQNCSNLRTINLPDTVQEIGQYAFNKCYMLHSIDIPLNMTEITGHTFEKSGLRNITIPSNITTIGYAAFLGCAALAGMTFETPAQLETIEAFAFDGCSALTSMELPERVNSIGGFAFRGYTGSTILLPTATPPTGYKDEWQNYHGAVVTTIADISATYNRHQNAIDYNINYNFHDSSNDYSGINPETYNIESAEIVLNSLPNRTNATFGGWYTQYDFTPSSVITSIPTGSTGNINLYAKWIYDIDIIANDSNGTITPNGTVQVVHGDDLVITAMPSSMGYTSECSLDTSIVHVGDVQYSSEKTYTIRQITGVGADNNISFDFNDLEAPMMVNNTGITINEGDGQIIKNTMLGATDVVCDDENIKFTISAFLSNGQIENIDNSGVAISSFTQKNIDDSKIKYVHNGTNTTSDGFTFKVEDEASNS